MYELALGCSVVLWVVVTGLYLMSRTASIYHPFSMYTAFHGLLFVIRPIFARVLDYQVIYRLYKFYPAPHDKLMVIVAANVGFLAFAFFSLYVGRDSMTFKQDRFTALERKRLTVAFLLTLALFLPLGLFSLIQTFRNASAGSAWGDMSFDQASGAFVNANGNGYLTDFQTTLATLACIFAWLFRFRLWALAPMALFILARAGTGGRGPFVMASVALGFIWLYENRSKFPTPRTLGLMALVIPLFVAVGQDRGQSIRALVDSTAVTQPTYVSRTQERFLEGMDFGNLEYFEYLVYVIPQRSGTYDYFLDNLQVLTEPIPRALWKNKPIGQPFQRIFLYNYGFPIGMTRSLPGEGWYGYGILGVFLWCGLWGAALGGIYRGYVRSNQSAIKTAAYMIFASTLIVSFRDGKLLTLIRVNGPFLAPIVTWYFIARMLAVPGLDTLRQRGLIAWRNGREVVPASGPADAVPEADLAPPPTTKWLDLSPTDRRKALAASISPKHPQGSFP